MLDARVELLDPAPPVLYDRLGLAHVLPELAQGVESGVAPVVGLLDGLQRRPYRVEARERVRALSLVLLALRFEVALVGLEGLCDRGVRLQLGEGLAQVLRALLELVSALEDPLGVRLHALERALDALSSRLHVSPLVWRRSLALEPIPQLLDSAGHVLQLAATALYDSHGV